MRKAWGIYVRYGSIQITKAFDTLLKAKQRYERLAKRKRRPGIWIALVPLHQ